MNKQRLTKRDIQKELLERLNRRRSLAIYLTVFILLGVVLYPVHLVQYLSGSPYDYDGGVWSPRVSPTVAMFVIPVVLIVLTVAVLRMYYIDMYKIKKGKFEIVEEKLCQKKTERMHYFLHSKEENSLYFTCGRVATDGETYSNACIGDEFYVVILKISPSSKRPPLLVFSKNDYAIEESQE